MREIVIGLVSAALGALISVLAQAYVTAKLEKSSTPIVTYSVSTPVLDGIPDSELKKIALVNTQIAVKHMSGKQAKNISLIIDSTEPFGVENFITSKSIESAKVIALSDRKFKIDIAELRPQGTVSVDIAHTPTNEISIAENPLIEDGGELLSSELYVSRKDNMIDQWWFSLAAIVTVTVSVLIVFYILIVISRRIGGAITRAFLVRHQDETFVQSVVHILVFAVVFNGIIRSGYAIGLELPTIPISDMFYATGILLAIIWLRRAHSDGSSTNPAAPGTE